LKNTFKLYARYDQTEQVSREFFLAPLVLHSALTSCAVSLFIAPEFYLVKLRHFHSIGFIEKSCQEIFYDQVVDGTVNIADNGTQNATGFGQYVVKLGFSISGDSIDRLSTIHRPLFYDCFTTLRFLHILLTYCVQGL
jgi:hypothetical protein